MNMKIQVVGLSGCGKTTLSKKISKKYNLKYFEIDDILYKKKYSQKNTDLFIESKIQKTLKEEKFILDGTFLNFKFSDYKKFDLIIIIKINFVKNLYFIFYRFFKNKEINFLDLLKNIEILFKTTFLENSKKVELHNYFIEKNCKYKIIKDTNFLDLEKLINI